MFSLDKRDTHKGVSLGKTVKKLLEKNNYALSPEELTELLSKEKIRNEREIFKIRQTIERIYKKAVKNGLVCTSAVQNAINKYRCFDYEKLYSSISEVCKILSENPVYSLSASFTKNQIRRRVLLHAKLHRIKETESAAIFSLKEDCGIVNKKKKGIIFLVGALVISALAGLVLKSPASVIISFFPILALLSLLFESVRKKESSPCSNIKDLPKTMLLTLFDASKADKVYRYFERLIALADKPSLVYCAVLMLPDSRSLTEQSDDAVIRKFRQESEKLQKKYSDRFCFYIPKRQYVPERKCYSSPKGRYLILHELMQCDSSFDMCLGAENKNQTAYTLILPYEVEPDSSCINNLICAMSHRMNRPVILSNRLEGGKGMICGRVKGYISQKRSTLARVSRHLEHEEYAPVIVDNGAFLLLTKKDMPEDEIKHRLECGYADYALSYIRVSSFDLRAPELAFNPYPHSPFVCERGLVKERVINVLRVLSPIMSFVMIFFSSALKNPLYYLCLAVMLSLLPYVNILSQMFGNLKKGRTHKGMSDLCDFLLASFLALSIIPFMFFEGGYHALKSLIFNKGASDKKKDSAKNFFTLTLSGLGSGILLLSIGAYPLLAFMWLVAPIFVMYLGTVRSKQILKLPKLINIHLKGAHDYIMGQGRKENLPPAGNNKKGDNVSPRDIGLYLVSLLAFCDMGKESLPSCYPLISDALTFVERLPTSYGLYYDSYSVKDLSPADEKTLSAMENGYFITCLISLCEGLRESLPEDDILILRCEKLIERAELERVCKSCCMSEISALPAYFLSCGAKGCDALATDTCIGALSESGSAESYMFPFLFLPVYPDTLFSRTINTAFAKNISFSRNGLWGVTSCHTGKLDNDMNHIYLENGISALSRAANESSAVYSPYAAFLFLPHFKISSISLLHAFRKERAMGKYGFYEAVDFTCSEKTVVRCYKFSHLCMSVISAANYALDNIFVKRFCQSKYANPYLYLLRCDKEARFAKFKVSELIPRSSIDKQKKEKECAVPRLCLVGNESLSFYASSVGHLMFVSRGAALSSDCFKEYDMKNTLDSVRVLFSTEKALYNALDGEFDYNGEYARYLSNHSDIVSNTKIIIKKDSAVCEIRLTVKGAFSKISACLDFKATSDVSSREGHFLQKSQELCVLYTTKSKSVLSKDKERFKINVKEECPDGVFICSFFISLASDEKKALSLICPAEISSDVFAESIEKEALLASVRFKAGRVRNGEPVSLSKLQNFENTNVICAICPESLCNVSLLSTLSKIVSEFSMCGLPLKLAVICKYNKAHCKILPYLSCEDIVLDLNESDEELIKALAAFAAMYIDEEDFLSPENFFKEVMNGVRSIDDCIYQKFTHVSRPAPPSCSHKTESGYITDSKAVFYKESLSYAIDFCIGRKIKVKLSSEGLTALYWDDRPLTSFIRLCVRIDGVKYDLISSCHTVEKSDGLVSFDGRINGRDVRCEIFMDDELSLVVIRVYGEGMEACLDLAPYSPRSDPRLCRIITEGDSTLYRSICEGFYSNNTLFVSKPCKRFDKQILTVGLYGSSPHVFYEANEKYSCPSGCEGPVAYDPTIKIYGPLKECDHLVCHRIPEFFGGLCLDAKKRIYGFPVLAVTDPQLFIKTLREYAASCKINGEDCIIMAAAIAQCFKTSSDDLFLREKVPYADSDIKESLYMHGIRAIENYKGKNDRGGLIRYLVCKMYEPVCRHMNESLDVPEIDRDLISKDAPPFFELCLLMLDGNTSKALSKLTSLCPGYGENDPTLLGIFYMIYLRFVIGIEDYGDRFTIKPRLCSLLPSFKMSYLKGSSKFIISASIADKDLTCLDKIPYEGDFYFDNNFHTIDISTKKRS